MSDKIVVLITGASSGIGFETARALTKIDCEVYGTCRNPHNNGYGFEMLKLDVTDQESVDECVAKVTEKAGKIDILINNAGFGLRGAVEEASIEDTKALFDTNLFGVLRMCKAVIPQMREEGEGMIINVSSIVGLVGMPFNGIYSASKFALEGMSQTLRLETAQFGIKVAVINPGFTQTKFAHNAVYSKGMSHYDSLRTAGQERIESGLGGDWAPEPDIVSEAIIEIIESAADESNYIIGEDSSALLDDWNDMEPEDFANKTMQAYNIDPK
jgi:NAD(P)-dependent dehydrogenase (short-subunit alcohol dehydrogenase family)